MSEKVGLKIVDLIYNIAQLGIKVSFTDDFEGMLTVMYEGDELDCPDHSHLGYPGCNRLHLEKEIIKDLASFLEKHSAQR